MRLLIGVVLMSFIFGRVVADCRESQVLACLEEVDSQLSENKFGTMTVPDIEILCRLLPDALQCVKDDGCTDITNIRYAQMLIFGVNNLCSQAQVNIFLESEDCLDDGHYHGAGQRCDSNYQMITAHLKPTDLDLLCSSTKKYVKCVNNVYKSWCGEDFSRPMTTFIIIYFQDLFESLKHSCNLENILDMSCMVGAMNSCWVGVEIFTEKIAKGSLTSQDLNTLCGELTGAFQCTMAAGCTRLKLMRMLRMLYYICTLNNKKIYIENQKCLATSRGKGGMAKMCRDVFEAADCSEVCSASKTYGTCVYDAYKSSCGEVAARFATTFGLIHLQHELDNRNLSCS